MDATTILFQEPYLVISREFSAPWLYAKWSGTLSESAVKSGCESLLQLTKQQQIFSLLNDNTESSACWSGALRWIVFDFLPRLQKSGLKHCAHVYGGNAEARRSAGAAALLFDQDNANVQVFRTLIEAKAWLRNSANE